jgi:hypothetical protein
MVGGIFVLRKNHARTEAGIATKVGIKTYRVNVLYINEKQVVKRIFSVSSPTLYEVKNGDK